MRMLRKLTEFLFSALGTTFLYFLDLVSDTVFKITNNPGSYFMQDGIILRLLNREISIPEPETGCKLRLSSCSGISRYRALTYADKEPLTSSWITQNSNADNVLLDIGANIGIVSLMFLTRGGLHAHLVEPLPINASICTYNMDLNDCADRATIWVCPLFSQSGVIHFEAPSMLPGGALAGVKKTKLGNVNRISFQIRALTVDDLVDTFPGEQFPTLIKIDVDGNEWDILAGASKTVNDPRLKSILVEVDSRVCDPVKVIDWMLDKNFMLTDHEDTWSSLDRSNFIRNLIFHREQ